MSLTILRVAQKCYPDVSGGGPYHVHALSRDQASAGHDVTVLTMRTDPEQPTRERRSGYTVLRADPTVSLLGNDLSLGVAGELRDAAQFDVVHAHSHLYASTVFAAVKRRRGDTPLAVTNHGLYSQSAPRWLFAPYIRTVGRWTFQTADRVFCYTAVDRDRLRTLGVTTPVSVVPNGIDLDRFSPDGPIYDDLAGDGPLVLFVGRLVGAKRPDVALEAFAAVHERDPTARLAFVGDGPRAEKLKTRTVELGLGDAVTFLGHCPYESLPAIYRASDVLVLPSEAEGLPRVVLEALASGVPAVTSDLPQLAMLLNGAGHTAPIGDVTATANALDDLLTDEAHRASLVSTGLSRVRDRHAWSDTVDRTTAVLATLAEAGPKQSQR